MKQLQRIIFGVVAWLLILPFTVWAWGPEGHEIIAEISLYYLTPVARLAVDDILGSYHLSDYDIATWPDTIRGNKEYKELYPNNGRWHYIDFDTGMKYDDDFELKPTENGDDVVTQVTRWRDELRSGKLKGERQLDALRFLVHFVGDLHQPMHCAFRYGDMGGNMLPVNSFTGEHYSFGPEDDLDYPPSLHAAWDEYLVQEMVAGRKTKAVVRALQREITDQDVRRWMKEDVLGWATDSYWIARKKAYRWTDGTPVPYTWSRPGMDLTRDNYIDSHVHLVDEQLKKAGVRLALMLNTALDPTYDPAAVSE
ncbi:MAG: S1/P1 nuclease [Kiritimatiellia bacterium]|jgi:hypothetical protein|nr:S1/P1 nuclease [Kiritimatiellia bacterium]